MEASTRENAPRDASVTERAAGERVRGQLFPMLFLGSVLAMYIVIGYALYTLIAVLV